MPANWQRLATSAIFSFGKNQAIATSIAIGEFDGVGARKGSTTPMEMRLLALGAPRVSS